MRAQRNKRMKFKNGKIYTISRIFALAIIFLILILLFFIFKPKTKNSDDLNISNTNSNMQTVAENNVQNSTANNTTVNNSTEKSSMQEDATFTISPVTAIVNVASSCIEDARRCNIYYGCYWRYNVPQYHVSRCIQFFNKII